MISKTKSLYFVTYNLEKIDMHIKAVGHGVVLYVRL